MRSLPRVSPRRPAVSPTVAKAAAAAGGTAAAAAAMAVEAVSVRSVSRRRGFAALLPRGNRWFAFDRRDVAASRSSSGGACRRNSRCVVVERGSPQLQQQQQPRSALLFSLGQQLRQRRLVSSTAAPSSLAAATRSSTNTAAAALLRSASLRSGQQQPAAGHASAAASGAATAAAFSTAAAVPTSAAAAGSAATAAAVPGLAAKAGVLQGSTPQWQQRQSDNSWAAAPQQLQHAVAAHADTSVQLPRLGRGLAWLLPSLSRSRRTAVAAKRQHVVILGTGWASVNFFRFLDPSLYDITIISPRNYFTFTPLLPSVCAGTLSPLACIEPVRALIQEGGRQTSTEFYEAHCTDVDFANRFVCCESGLGGRFKLRYDFLVIAVGSEVNTFGVKDVARHAFFLREVEHAMLIRKQVMNNFEQAALPQTSESEKRRLLHFVVVGGGPTGVESAAEFADFIREDMRRCFPQLMPFVSVTLIEGGGRLLPTYSEDISAFAARVLSERLHVKLLLRSVVTHVDATTVQFVTTTPNGKETRTLSQGFVLWASGVGQVPLVKKLLQEQQEQQEAQQKQQQKQGSAAGGDAKGAAAAGRRRPAFRGLPVDAQLRLLGQPRVYAIGDCAVLTPRRLQDDAAELYSRSGPSQPGARWLESQAAKLQEIYPQLSPSKFDFSKIESSQRDAPLSFEQFKELLGQIDAAYQPPAPTAQNARQEGLYLAAVFNSLPDPAQRAAAPAFKEKWNGSLAYVGDGQAVAQLPYMHVLGGFFSLPLWKAVYMRMQITWRSRMICLFDWLKTAFAGRDVGRDHQYYRNNSA